MGFVSLERCPDVKWSTKNNPNGVPFDLQLFLPPEKQAWLEIAFSGESRETEINTSSKGKWGSKKRKIDTGRTEREGETSWKWPRKK